MGSEEGAGRLEEAEKAAQWGSVSPAAEEPGRPARGVAQRGAPVLAP